MPATPHPRQFRWEWLRVCLWAGLSEVNALKAQSELVASLLSRGHPGTGPLGSAVPEETPSPLVPVMGSLRSLQPGHRGLVQVQREDDYQ